LLWPGSCCTASPATSSSHRSDISQTAFRNLAKSSSGTHGRSLRGADCRQSARRYSSSERLVSLRR
jgi:hypothetical protein